MPSTLYTPGMYFPTVTRKSVRHPWTARPRIAKECTWWRSTRRRYTRRLEITMKSLDGAQCMPARRRQQPSQQPSTAVAAEPPAGGVGVQAWAQATRL